jgi:cell division protein FtsQ
VRAGNLFSNRGSAVLDAPEPVRAPKGLRAAGLKRSAPVTEMPLRRDGAYDYPEDEPEVVPRERRGMRINLGDGLIPKTLGGRIAAFCLLALIAGAAIAASIETRSFLLHDSRFIVPDEHAIQVAGASHLTHAQLLSIFGEDVDRNIFMIPLSERRAELERLPWVEHATVMRLLPDHLRVSVVERTPVAFVREGAHIALVDATGALFDMPGPEMIAASGGTQPHYSFPVLTGISAADPLSTRGARMKICIAFIAALDSTGEKISSKLSEIDLSDPEDIRAVISDSGGSDVLVHFGEDHFLDRYHAYRQHLAEWRAQYPKLASVDMRYEQQVVLGMKPDAPGTAASPAPATPSAATASAVPPTVASGTSPAAPTKPSTVVQPSVAKSAVTAAVHPAPVKSTARHAVAKRVSTHPVRHAKTQPKKTAHTKPTLSHTTPGAAAPPTHAISEVAR